MRNNNDDHPFQLPEAKAYLRQNITAGFVVQQALTDTRVQSRSKRDRCTQAAGYLYASGWMSALHATRCGYVSDAELATINAKLAYRQLQAVGIAPSFWVLSWVVRNVLVPFLINLFLRHAVETWMDERTQGGQKK